MRKNKTNFYSNPLIFNLRPDQSDVLDAQKKLKQRPNNVLCKHYVLYKPVILQLKVYYLCLQGSRTKIVLEVLNLPRVFYHSVKLQLKDDSSLRMQIDLIVEK